MGQSGLGRRGSEHNGRVPCVPGMAAIPPISPEFKVQQQDGARYDLEPSDRRASIGRLALVGGDRGLRRGTRSIKSKFLMFSGAQQVINKSQMDLLIPKHSEYGYITWDGKY